VVEFFLYFFECVLCIIADMAEVSSQLKQGLGLWNFFGLVVGYSENMLFQTVECSLYTVPAPMKMAMLTVRDLNPWCSDHDFRRFDVDWRRLRGILVTVLLFLDSCAF